MRKTVLVNDTDVLENNARIIKSAIGTTKLTGVVKADAYGHGIVRTARAFLSGGADFLAVAIAEEALTLRENGIGAPILILGALDNDLSDDLVKNSVSQAVFDVNSLYALSRAAEKTGTRAKAHLKIDTGMSRIGVRGISELKTLLDVWKNTKNVEMEGIFTHFCVSETDKEYTRLQADIFEEAVSVVRAYGFDPIRHAAATGAFMEKNYRYDMVRPGIAMYGGCDLPGVSYAQTLKTRAVRIQSIKKGDTVSYGRTYTAEKDALIATIPIGYGDGYPRVLSNKAFALVHGKRVPVAGRVCMDMMMLDVSGIENMTLDDEIVLMGRQGDESITPDELADLAGTIPYEIMLGFSARVRHEYL